MAKISGKPESKEFCVQSASVKGETAIMAIIRLDTKKNKKQKTKNKDHEVKHLHFGTLGKQASLPSAGSSCMLEGTQVLFILHTCRMHHKMTDWGQVRAKL